MSTSPDLNWQPSLLDVDQAPSIDTGFKTLTRTQLDAASWVDYAPGWVAGSDPLFDELVTSLEWVAQAGPRISIAFRHGLDPTIYDNAEATSSRSLSSDSTDRPS